MLGDMPRKMRWRKRREVADAIRYRKETVAWIKTLEAEVEARKLELAGYQSPIVDDMPHGSDTSDPTLRKVMAIVLSEIINAKEAEIRAESAKLEAMETVYRAMDGQEKEILRMGYWDKTHTEEGVMAKLEITSWRTYSHIRDSALTRIGIVLGILRP